MQLLTVSRTTSAALALATSLFLACGGGTEEGQDAGPGPGGYVTIEAVTPDHGPLAGGNTVVVTGSGFLLAGADRNNALLGGILANRVSVLDDNTLEVVVPPGSEAGPVGITLFNGNGSASLGDVYSYNPLPTVTATDPSEGDYQGGDTVTITGSGFQELEAGTNTVLFGNAEAEIVEVNSDTSITVTAPAGTPTATVLVTVENDNGASSPFDGYLYNTDGFLVFGHSAGGDANVDDPNNPELGEIFHLDPLTGVVESIGQTIKRTGEFGASICAPSTIHDGLLYTKGQGDQLLKHDINSNSTERLDPLAGCTRVHALASHQGQLLAICRFNNNGGDFGAIDPVARTFTPIGNVEINGGRTGLASDGTTLYLLEESQLSQMNPSTGERTQTVNLTEGNMRGIGFSGGVLYGLQRSFGGKGGGGFSVLHSINPVNGQTQDLGFVGVNLRGLVSFR